MPNPIKNLGHVEVDGQGFPMSVNSLTPKVWDVTLEVTGFPVVEEPRLGTDVTSRMQISRIEMSQVVMVRRELVAVVDSGVSRKEIFGTAVELGDPWGLCLQFGPILRQLAEECRY